MTRRAGTAELLRARGSAGSQAVTPVELFFDLVFVYAITRVSHFLLAHLTAVGAIQTLLLFVGVWWVWVYTAWVTNWLDPDRRIVRIALLALMLLGLVLSICLPEAFTSQGLTFAGAYVLMQVGRTGFMLWAVRDHAAQARNFVRILCWFALSANFWIAGGLAKDGARLCCWAIALGLELVSPMLAFWAPVLGRSTTSAWEIATSHLAERCSLFVLIALGESLVVIGATFAEAGWDGITACGFVAAFIGTASLWWIYFDTAAESTREAFAGASNTGALARSAYSYAHAILVAGIVVVAVGNERMLAQPRGSADPVTVAMIVGGPAIFLVGNALFRWLVHPRIPRSHVVGLCLLAALAIAGTYVPVIVLGAGSAATLAATALLGSVLHARRKATPNIEYASVRGS